MTRTVIESVLGSDRTKSGRGRRPKPRIEARAYPTDPDDLVNWAIVIRQSLTECWKGDRIGQGVLERTLSAVDFMEDAGRAGVVLVPPSEPRRRRMIRSTDPDK